MPAQLREAARTRPEPRFRAMVGVESGVRRMQLAVVPRWVKHRARGHQKMLMLRSSVIVIVPVQNQLDGRRDRFVRQAIVIVVCKVQGRHGAAEPTMNERRDRQEGHGDVAAD